jgi:Leucine-rich repeat (LRR) protein
MPIYQGIELDQDDYNIITRFRKECKFDERDEENFPIISLDELEIEEQCGIIISDKHIIGFGMHTYSDLPDYLGGLKHIEYLILSNNTEFTMHPFIQRLKNLKNLSISYSYLTEIPDWITNLPHLQKLKLISNNFESHDIENLNKINQISSLYLDYNFFKEFPQKVLELTNLKLLSLSYNHFREIPEEISKLKNLRILNLYNCEYLEKLPNSITQLNQLEELSLENCPNLKNNEF